MVKPASTPHILKLRLSRFFNAPNAGRQQVQRIVKQLSTLGEVYLFGGAIRDIALEGVRNFYSDLDFVIDCESSTLDDLMSDFSGTFKVKKNKFGGYRMQCDKWWLDIWTLKNTWAFKNQLITEQTPEQLLNTTILNWDAIIYRPIHNCLVYPTHYFESLSQGILDINLADNPNPLGAYVRVLRTLVSKQVQQLNPKLQAFITEGLNRYSDQEALFYEQSHFKTCYLAQLNLTKLAEKHNFDLNNPIKWQPDNHNLSLPL